MTALRTNAQRLQVLAALLAMADERRQVSLMEAADELGVSTRELRELLDPVLYLEWRDADGELLGETRAFLLTDDDELIVSEEHWLRGIASTRPDPPTALRLFVAGVILQAATRDPLPVLDRALERLKEVLDAEVVVHFDRPQWTDFLEEAQRSGRTVEMRYLSHIGGRPHDLHLEPHLVASRWGNWYLFARVLTSDPPPTGHLVDDERIFPFRIDRILSAGPGGADFEPEAVEVPEWWDMSEHERKVIVRVAPDDLRRVPEPGQSTVLRELDDGRVEAEIMVIGPRRLEHLLLLLGPAAEIVWPDEMPTLQRDLAREVLARYS